MDQPLTRFLAVRTPRCAPAVHRDGQGTVSDPRHPGLLGVRLHAGRAGDTRNQQLLEGSEITG